MRLSHSNACNVKKRCKLCEKGAGNVLSYSLISANKRLRKRVGGKYNGR